MKPPARVERLARSRASIAVLAIGMALAGCGGGGADESAAASPDEGPTAIPSPSPAPASSAPAAVSPVPVPSPIPGPPPVQTPGPIPAPIPVEAKIMALGDSMTAGGEVSGSAYRSYRGYLDQQLTAGGYLVDFIGSRSHQPTDGGDPDHEGYGGLLVGPDNLSPPETDTIYDRVVGNGFNPILTSAISPDVIILALGWNSANYRGRDAANQYQRLVSAVQALKPRATLVLATLSPPEGQSEAQSDVVSQGYRELNARARELANASATDNLLLADLARGGFQSSDYVAPNDIHWSRGGATRAASIIFQVLVAGKVLDASLLKASPPDASG